MNAIGGINSDGSQTRYDENNIYKYRESKHLLWPLPVSEIDSNTSIATNNPGWS
ncbi:RagB/SusD family nutrient uptake outer membrane protein [Heminiphilus faecis]|nr:RagB/SusD family nutrient uptake outer membrane protein [Heminiphilus faecis]